MTDQPGLPFGALLEPPPPPAPEPEPAPAPAPAPPTNRHQCPPARGGCGHVGLDPMYPFHYRCPACGMGLVQSTHTRSKTR